MSPIGIPFVLENCKKKVWNWRLNESIIQDEQNNQEIKKELEYYFKINRSYDTSPQTLWEAHKAVIRGICIKIGSKIKKQREKI